MPQLFYSAGSPYARICRMALREGGLMDRVEEAETTLRDPAAVMLPHNPVGRVPALLLEDGTTLTETTLVLSWLDRMGSAPRMLPEDASSMAAYGRSWAYWTGLQCGTARCADQSMNAARALLRLKKCVPLA